MERVNILGDLSLVLKIMFDIQNKNWNLSEVLIVGRDDDTY